MEAPSVESRRKIDHNSGRHYSDRPNQRYYNIYGPNPEYRRNSIVYDNPTFDRKIAISVR